MMCDCIQRFLKVFFKRLALITSRHPKKFILFPFIFTLICVPGGIWNFRFIKGVEYQFSPKNGRVNLCKRRTLELFPMNYSSDFSPSRQVELKAYGRFIVEARDGGSVLRPYIFEEILEIDRRVKELTVHKDDLEWKYRHLCAREAKRCYQPQLLKLKPSIPDINNGIYKVKYPIHIDINKNTFQVYSMSLGGMELDDDNHIISSKAAALEYYLDTTNPKFVDLNREWEDMFLQLGERYSSGNITLHRFISRTLEDESDTDTFSTMMYFVVTVCLMLAFSSATSMMADCVRSKPWLGLIGCLSSNLATGASFGFLLTCGVELALINLVIPFLLLGIGLDDSFVIMAAWRRSSSSKSVEERLVETYQHAGVSITITSLTNLISFLMGATSPYYAPNLLCYYAALSVLLAFIYQLSFFGGFFVLFAYEEARNRHSLTFQKAIPVSLAKHHGKFFRLCCTGGRDLRNPDNPEDNKDHLGMVLFRDWLGRWLSLPSVKALVFLLYFIYLSGAIYGYFHLKEGMNTEEIFGKGNYANAFSVAERKYFYNYIMRYQVIIDEPLDYSDKAVQQKYLDVVTKLESLPYSSQPNLTEAWLKHYLEFLNDRRSNLLTLWRYNLSNKADFYDCLRKNFFKHPLFKNYQYDVVFNEDGSEIIASRFFFQAEGVKDSVMLQDLTVDFWNNLEDLPLKAYAYHPLMYMLEIHMGLFEFTLKTVIITGIMIMIVTFAFIPQFLCSIWVAFAVVSIEFGLVGFMPYWDINLNSPTMVTLIISVGFSVDNTAHITIAYLSSKMQTPSDKMRDSLYYVGMPISQACISTIIGVTLLLFTPSHVFQLFSKMIILLMCFALFHSLVLLPVLLSLTESLNSKLPYRKGVSVKNNMELTNESNSPFISESQKKIFS